MIGTYSSRCFVLFRINKLTPYLLRQRRSHFLVISLWQKLIIYEHFEFEIWNIAAKSSLYVCMFFIDYSINYKIQFTHII